MTLGALRILLGVNTSGLKEGRTALTGFVKDAERQLTKLEGFARSKSGLFVPEGLEEGTKQIRQFAQQGKKEIQSLEATLKQASRSFTEVGRSLTLAITVPLTALATLGVRGAIRAEEEAARFAAAFGPEADRINRILENLKATIPAGTGELQNMSASIRELTRSMGLSARTGENMSVELIKIADAVAKVQGRRTADVFDALRSGIAGNTRGLKEYGIVIDDTVLKQEAYRLGLIKQGQELTAAGKAVAALNIIQRQTASTMQSAGNTADGAARKLQRMRVQLTEMAEELGRRLLPSLLSLGNLVVRVLDAFSKLDPTLQNSVIALTAIAAVSGPILFMFGSLVKLVLGVASAFRVLTTASAAAALSPAGPVLVGLALLAGAYLLIKNRLDDATKSQEGFTRSLRSMTKEELGAEAARISVEMSNVQTQLSRATRNLETLQGIASGGGSDAGITRMAADASQRIKKLEQDAAALAKQLIAVGAAAKTLTAAGGDDGAPIFGTDGEVTAIEAMQKQAARIAGRFELIADKSKLTRDYWDQIQQVIKGAQSLFDAQGGAINEVSNGALEILNSFRELDAQRPPRFIEIMGQNMQGVIDRLRGLMAGVRTSPTTLINTVLDAQIKSLETAASRFAGLKDQLDLALVRGSTGAVAAIRRDMEDLQRIAKQTGGQLAALLSGGGLTQEQRTTGIAALRTLFEALGLTIGDTTEPTTKLQKALEELQAAGQSAFAGITNSINSMSESLSRAVRGTLLLLSSLSQAAAALQLIKKERAAAEAAGKKAGLGSIGAIAGLVGGVVGIVGAVESLAGAIFGQTQVQREMQGALKNNAERIAAAMAELSGTLRGAANLRNAGAATAVAVRIIERGGSAFAVNVDVRRELERFGLSLQELNAIAQDNGIQILTSEGQIIGSAFEQLSDMLSLTVDSLTRWGKSLEAQRGRLDLIDMVNNVQQSPMRALERELALLVQQGSPLADFFTGLDATTKEGREQFRGALGRILKLIDKGVIADLLGNLTGIDELNGIVRGLATALNEMDTATRSLTESLTNVPTGFRIAAARFNAAAPVTSGLLPTVGVSGVNVTFAAGAIVAQPGEDVAQLATRIVSELEQRSRRRSGTPVTGVS